MSGRMPSMGGPVRPPPNLSLTTSNRSRPELTSQLASPGQTTKTTTMTKTAPTAAKIIRK